MPAQRTDKERLVAETWRLARIIWRHSPSLRSAVEKDDWFQEAAAAVLELPHAPDQQGISRMLRALAARLMRSNARHALAVRLSSEQFDRFEAPERLVHRTRRLALRPFAYLGGRQSARFGKQVVRLTPGAVARLHRLGFSQKAIARRFRVSRWTVYRCIRCVRTLSGSASGLPREKGRPDISPA